jgi:hypothetical protein
MKRSPIQGRLWVALAALALAAACYSKTADGTSLVIEADFDPSLGIDQLTFSGVGPDGGSAFGPATKPTSPGPTLSSGQTVRVLLADSWGGATLNVTVEGLGSSGSIVAWGQQPVAISQGREADLKVPLSAGSPPDAGLCASGVGFAGRLCSDKWCWEYPTPQSNFLSGVWVANDCTVFAVGAGGAILQKDGGTWSFPGSGVGEYLSAVWGTSSTDVWAVGDCGAILHWDGSSWGQSVVPNCAPASGRVFLNGVFALDPNNAWAVGANGGSGVIEYWDGGSWQPVGLGSSAPAFTSVWFSGPQDGWAATGSGKPWHWDGSNWQGFSAANNAPLFGVFGFDAGDVWAVGGVDAGINVGSQGAIINFQGSSWAPLAPTPPAQALPVPLFSLWGTSPENLVVVGADSTNGGYASFFAGQLWTEEPLPYVHSVFGAPDGTIWVVGSNGVVYRGGIGTVGLELPVNINSTTKPASLTTVVQNGSDVWAFGTGGLVLHLENGTWNVYPAPPGSLSLQAGWEFGPQDVWAAGSDGMLVQTDGGGSWNAVLPARPGTPGWLGAAGRVFGTSRELWLVGSDFEMSRVSIAPTGVTTVPCTISGLDGGVDAGAITLRGVTTPGPETYAVGDDGVIVHHGASLSATCDVVQYGGADLKAVWGASTTDLWAVGSSGTVLHGNGLTWTPQVLPGSPTDTFYAVGGNSSGPTEQVWVSGTNGTTFRFDGSSGNWTRETLGSTNTSLSVTSGGSNDAYVVGASNEIIHRSP